METLRPRRPELQQDKRANAIRTGLGIRRRRLQRQVIARIRIAIGILILRRVLILWRVLVRIRSRRER